MTLAEDTPVRVAVLGPVTVEGPDATPVEPAGALGKSFIALLALAPGRTLPAQALIDGLWGGKTARQGKAALHTLVSRLRRRCAPGLVLAADGGYTLAVPAAATDVGRARACCDRARQEAREGRHAAAAAQADAALALWRGEPGTGLTAASAPAVQQDSATLRARLRRIRAESLLLAGRVADAVPELAELAATAPLDESLHLLLMRGLAAAGRPAEALRVFARLRSTLRDELGASPAAEVTAFNARLLRDRPPTREARLVSPPNGTTGVASPAEADAAAAAEPPAALLRVGLRAAPNELLGRDDDVARIEQLLLTCRLVTVLGPGGIGKTRLAQEVARRAADPSVVVIELASLQSGADIAAALAAALGVTARGAGPGTRSLLQPLGSPDLHTRILDVLARPAVPARPRQLRARDR